VRGTISVALRRAGWPANFGGISTRVLEISPATVWRFHLVLLFGIASVVIAFALVWISYLS
jgi:hypothetical protein